MNLDRHRVRLRDQDQHRRHATRTRTRRGAGCGARSARSASATRTASRTTVGSAPGRSLWAPAASTARWSTSKSTTFVGDTGNSTKIVYYSPTIAGFQLAVELRPAHWQQRHRLRRHQRRRRPGHGRRGPDLARAASGSDGRQGFGGRQCRAGPSRATATPRASQPGVVLSFGKLSIAGGYGWDETLGAKHQFYNVGAGYTLGPVALSINWGQVIDTNNRYQAQQPNGLPVGSDKSNAVILGAAGGAGPRRLAQRRGIALRPRLGRRRQWLALHQPAAVHLLNRPAQPPPGRSAAVGDPHAERVT